MGRGTIIGVILLSMVSLHAQEITVPTKAHHILDSLSALASKQWLTDSLSVGAWGDSIRSGIESKTLGNINHLNRKIDSLHNLGLPDANYRQKIDSLKQTKDKLLAEVNTKQQALLGNAKNKLTEWQNNIQTKLGIKGKGLNLPSGQLPNVPDLNIPSTDFKIPSLGSSDFQSLGLSKELSEVSQSLDFIKPDGLGQWQEKIGGIAGNVPSLESLKNNPDQLIDKALTNIDGVSELKQKLNAGGLENTELGMMAKKMENPEAMKQVAVEQIKQEAFNHFAGKEQVLQAAMEKISKYKQQYSSISSLSEIKKRPPNPMKGKPLIERIVPGIAIQIHTKKYLNFDFNPYAAYRMSGRFSMGLGWNQRLAVDWSTKKAVGQGKVYGLRVFGEFKLPKGFAVRLELEDMNTFVPSYFIAPGEGHREWVFSSMLGIKKEYRFFKMVKGFTIVQLDYINLIKPGHKSPYSDVINTRFGFEFPMKQKNKK